MVRAVLGFILGIIIAFVVVIGAQALVNYVYPLPRGLNVFDRAAMEAVFRAMPASQFAMILTTYFLGGLAGGFVATKVGNAYWPLWAVAIIIALVAAMNVFTYPHPVWAQIGAIVGPLVGGWVAKRLAGPLRIAVPVEDDVVIADDNSIENARDGAV